MVLGSQALSRLKERVADYETQTELAASTDFPAGELVVPGINHVDLYDKTDIIPFDKLENFFKENM